MSIDHAAAFFEPQLINHDLDPGFIFVVAPAKAVIDMQDGIAIGQQIGLRHKCAELPALSRRPPQTATNQHPIANLSLVIADDMQADIMKDRRIQDDLSTIAATALL